MGEVRRELRVYNEEYVCDSCGEGSMQFIAKKTRPERTFYEHMCPNCREYAWLYDRYPKKVYVYKTNEQAEDTPAEASPEATE